MNLTEFRNSTHSIEPTWPHSSTVAHKGQPFSVETRAFSVEYLLVLYDGGEEEKIKSQRNLVARGLKGTL
jgi:hypothetical protein